MYPILKYLHVLLAIVTFGGFLLRAYWMVTGSANLQRRSVRIVPHVIDTAFLLSGIGLILVLRLNFTEQAWLPVKLVALICYIVLGAIALKRGRTPGIRVTALLFAVLTFTYIVGVAVSKSPASWMATM